MTMTKFSRINKQREEITMRVLEDMEKGGNEWKKPWVEASPLPPHNPVSGTQYSGRNFLYTYVYGMMRGYADPRWATEKQIKEMGWKIPENLQNGRGGINDELGVGIEHWGMYAYIPRVKKDGTPLIAALLIALLTLISVSLSMFSRRNLSSISSETERVRAERIPSGRAVLHGLSIAERSCSRMYRSLISAMLPLVSSNRTNALAPFSLSTMISLKHLPPSLFCKILPLILIRPSRFSPCFC